MGKDYAYAICPLLEDALMDRDLVHRQIACNVVKRKHFFSFFFFYNPIFLFSTHVMAKFINKYI